MNRTEFDHAQAEIEFLNRMTKGNRLSDLTRLSLQARLDNISDSLRDPDRGVFEPARAVVTYRGAPVRGVHGILAEFGAIATSKFSDAVAAVAASLGGVLNDFGPIPNKAQNQILITGTAKGSFGFQFEECPPAEAQLPLNGTSSVSQAFELVAELLEASIKGDEELSDPASKLGTRALALISEYLDKLISYDAYCAVSTKNHFFSFSSVDQVRISKSRLSAENITEDVVYFYGEFLGIFPAERRFEFKSNDGQILHGRISPDVENPAEINAKLNQNFKVRFTSRTVGKGKPRFTLAERPW
ncbi:hypothetical protein LJR232_002697 [Aquipseudomonas alcaligenes]